jgi:hypothetical protein
MQPGAGTSPHPTRPAPKRRSVAMSPTIRPAGAPVAKTSTLRVSSDLNRAQMGPH